MNDDVRWLSSDEQRSWRAFLDVTRMLFNALDRQLLDDAGLSLVEYDVLVNLEEAPEQSLRMRDLSKKLTVTRSGITRVISRMEQAGWVEKVQCETDRRGSLARLTEAGQEKLRASAPGHVEAVRREFVDRMTPEELTVLGRVWVQMRDGEGDDAAAAQGDDGEL